jgi:phage antirepressor YoqD-like protein
MVPVTEAAKILKLKPTYLFDWLRDNGWTYRRGGRLQGMQCRIDRGHLAHKVHTDDRGRAHHQMYVTESGIAELSKRMVTQSGGQRMLAITSRALQ